MDSVKSSSPLKWFCEGLETALNQEKTFYTLLVGDFYTRRSKRQIEVTCLGQHSTGRREERGQRHINRLVYILTPSGESQY